MTLLSVSLFFSIIIFNGATIEFRRALKQVEQRIELNNQQDEAGSSMVLLPRTQDAELQRQQQLLRFREAFSNDISVIQYRVGTWLLATNGVIFMLAAVGSFMLAGRTLSPIQDTLERQKVFVADASHELKTPLTALKTSLEVALRDSSLSKADAKSVLSESLAAVNQLQSLTDHLLTAARSQEVSRYTQRERFGSHEVLQEVLTQLAPMIQEKSLVLTQKLQAVTLKADRQSFKQLVTIFLDNAIKYTPQKGSVSVVSARAGRNLRVIICDTGSGIAKADIPHIFDRFYRAEHSRSKTGQGGYGLGLALAKQIVDAYGGDVTVSSSANKGTCFTVVLPL